MKGFWIYFFFLAALAGFAQPTDTLVYQKEGSTPGYVLFAPLHSKSTFLVDKCGNIVHAWFSRYNPAQSVYLLPDGSLLHTGYDSITHDTHAMGGKIERIGWNNEKLWSYSIASQQQRQHHDICPMPNGNILAIVYRKRSKEELVVASRKPSDDEPFLMDEKIVEIKPIGRDSGTVVWEWDAWDHLIQDVSIKAPHYGVVAQNPQLININFAPTPGTDWLHFNSVAYNPSLDQIVVSIHEFSEIFIIDHSTTTTEAASHKGGKQGKGGDILYRWGNPAAYKAGQAKDQKFFKQHQAHWIDEGMTDGGKIMVFNNGQGRPGKMYSSVDIIAPTLDKNGNYIMKPGSAAGPSTPSWSYVATDSACFYSHNVSSAQRLANGHTLICAGYGGKFFEIDSAKNIVWGFANRIAISEIELKGFKGGRQVFRGTFYEPTYEAFRGKGLAPCAGTELNPERLPCFSE